ncbi:MAG: hypothetical protein G8237_07535 [Magnetococcales bacterium]|nr:hypothetical protein [Magnetococcales bacterium]
MSELAGLIEARLRNKQKLFVSRTEFFKLLGSGLCRTLGVTPKDSVVRLGAALQSHCGDRVRVVQGGRAFYVTLNVPDDAYLRDKAQRLTSPFTPAQLVLNLPLSKVRAASALTRILASGELICIGVRSDFIPLLSWQGQTEPKSVEEDAQAFQRAFNEIGQGRNFVAIHRLRAHLGWERDRFDRILRELQAEERILLNMGDPTRLSRVELENGFVDRNGMRYLTLNWLGFGR